MYDYFKKKNKRKHKRDYVPKILGHVNSNISIIF